MTRPSSMTRAIACALLAGLAAAPSRAAPPGRSDPNWPCFQIKVASLSLASVWTGPPTAAYEKTWAQDTQVAALVGRISQRRMSIDDARKAIAAFASDAGAQKQTRLLAVMRGVYDTLNDERASVMNGLDRYGARQKALADQVRAEAAALRDRQMASTQDQQAIAQATQQLTWDSQVFEDRRLSVSTACDIPTVIDQRFFALAQAIQQSLG